MRRHDVPQLEGDLDRDRLRHIGFIDLGRAWHVLLVLPQDDVDPPRGTSDEATTLLRRGHDRALLAGQLVRLEALHDTDEPPARTHVPTCSEHPTPRRLSDPQHAPQAASTDGGRHLDPTRGRRSERLRQPLQRLARPFAEELDALFGDHAHRVDRGQGRQALPPRRGAQRRLQPGADGLPCRRSATSDSATQVRHAATKGAPNDGGANTCSPTTRWR